MFLTPTRPSHVMWPKRITNQEEPPWAEPEALETYGQSTEQCSRKQSPPRRGPIPTSGLGVLQSICSMDSYISVTGMGLAFFLSQVGGFIEAILDECPHCWGVYGGRVGEQADLLFSLQVIRSGGVSFGSDGEVCTSPRDPRFMLWAPRVDRTLHYPSTLDQPVPYLLKNTAFKFSLIVNVAFVNCRRFKSYRKA